MSEFPEIMSTAKAAAFLGVSRQWLELHRNDDCSPPWARIGKLYRYRRSSLERWLSEKERAFTSEEGSA